MLRIVHVGFGPLGQRVVSDLYARRLGEVVGLVDVSPELAGRTLRDFVPQAAGASSGPGDRPVVAGLDSALDAALASGRIDAAVVTTSSDLAACAPTFRTLLKRGLPVVSTCEELIFPWLRHAQLAQELDALARAHGGKLLGTGVNPGAMMDTIPVFVTAVCSKVHSVEVHRIQDATTRRLPFQKKIGATLDRAAFDAGVRAGWLRHVGLGESLHFVAHYLGLPFERWEESIEPVIADAPTACGIGPIAAGCALGVRQVATGWRGDDPVVRMVFQAAIGQADPMDRVIVRGEPELDVRFTGGVHGDIATSAMTLNAIGSLMMAPPGLHTSATVPLLRMQRARV
jgi:4-hydroxy-tetrahydrodipicolinate reductase